ncbi:uncharacterized protein CPUR_08830 [Claviceps purpurea 20.1]|uniref:Uncharacterized protein n=1 Tax=Claviceps purpurea (strain 20.1) TaxID=1111077 RepID=M1W6V6_CLAP2|nr:uncharacterized protein CPUR_08830 [Claviceps purpurea 20.1]
MHRSKFHHGNQGPHIGLPVDPKQLNERRCEIVMDFLKKPGMGSLD